MVSDCIAVAVIALSFLLNFSVSFTKPSFEKFQLFIKTRFSEKRFTCFSHIYMTGEPMIWLLLFFALTAGMLLPVQSGVNAELRTFVGHPFLAAAIQFLVGTVVLFLVFMATRAPLPAVGKLASAPWWIWLGGICGANFIVVAIVLAPRLGAATLVAVGVTGQMLVSLVLDHYGLIGYPVHPTTPWRIVGTVLLLAGVALIQRF
jgi:transporter family-2 protein